MERRAARTRALPRKFEAELLDGHKRPAVIVPFDPASTWGISPVPVESEAYGVRPGFPIRGRLNSTPFLGWIGQRWGRFFILVDEKLRRRARVRVGDQCTLVVAPAVRAERVSASRGAPRSRRSGPRKPRARRTPPGR